MADYPIKIKFDGTNVSPQAIPPLMKVGKTVEYFSDEGEVLVVFPELSPFRNDNAKATFVQGAMDLPLKQPTPDAGVPCRCFVRPAGNTQFIGWRAEPSPAGGNHVVK